jgi:hypothetical protein
MGRTRGISERRPHLRREEEPLVKPVALDPLWLRESVTCDERRKGRPAIGSVEGGQEGAGRL